MDLCDKLIIGESKEILRIKQIIRHFESLDYSTVIVGEPGVGKRLIARTIHLISTRKSSPFIEVSCPSIPPDLLDIELFGYQKYHEDGITDTKKGKFQLATGGTIFLDEIGEASLSAQAKLLRVIQEKKFIHKDNGVETPIKIDCRIIASTNQNFEELVAKGLFREDFYYRLNVIPITIPPLRERLIDIKPLFKHFALQFKQKTGKPIDKIINRGIPDFFYDYYWPGNVEEFKQTVNKLIISDDLEAIRKKLLAFETPKKAPQISIINKFIEFPPELYQSGMLILTYFGTIIRKKYPEKNVKVKIEQDGLTVRMIIETPEGDKEQVEKTMQHYGQVILGKTTPDSFFDNRLDVVELKHQLNMAKVQLETQKELLNIKNGVIHPLFWKVFYKILI